MDAPGDPCRSSGGGAVPKIVPMKWNLTRLALAKGRRSIIGAGLAAALGGASLVSAGIATPPASATPSITQTWSVTFNDVGNPVALSSPVVASLPGGLAAIVGDRAGHVYAQYLANGSTVPGWPVNTGGVPVDSPPSVSGGVIFFGAGNAADPHAGGAFAETTGGQQLWGQIEHDPAGNNYQANGESAGLTVGNLQGQVDVVAPSLGQNMGAYNAATGAGLTGFPWFTADTVFSTAAIGDVEGNGTNQIIDGGASTAGVAYGQTYTGGGHIRILRPSGNAGYSEPNQGLYCEYDTNQDVMSSPAIGQFLSGGQVGVVVGTGNESVFAGGSDNHALIAINKYCAKQWEIVLDGDTTSSPALADLFGNGGLEVVEGTNNGSGGGSVYAVNGTNGAVIWRTAAMGEVIGGVVTADLFGQGYQDVVVPTTAGAEVLDGKTGAVVATVERGLGLQSSPLITADPNGTIGITVAGYNGSNQGMVEHFEVAGSNGGVVSEAGAWPEFHHDPQLTGNAGTPPPTIQVPCNRPSGAPNGYYMAASDGGVFNFGNLPYCGSTGSIILNKPVVDISGTPDGGGYWLAASDGGIFNFGDAGYYGSTGNTRLNAPIVGMASTADGRGYWLVASDGGIFNFGDAPYLGSTGAIRLNKPVVGMADDPSTGGYWLVASDGGIFNFGAPYLGSTGAITLNKPMVEMAGV